MRPPADVLAAFGVSAEPERLPGGSGTAWRCGELVAEAAGHVDRGARVAGSAVRAGSSRTASASRGCAAISDGWCAWEHVRRRAPRTRLAGDHRRRRALPRRRSPASRAPSFLDRRTNHWAIGERVAWGELPAEDFAHVKHVPRLVGGTAPDRRGREPARPRRPDRQRALRGRAAAGGDRLLALLAADGLRVGRRRRRRACSGRAPTPRLLKAVAHVDDFPQLLVRALIFRAVVDALFRAGEPQRSDERRLASSLRSSSPAPWPGRVAAWSSASASSPSASAISRARGPSTRRSAGRRARRRTTTSSSSRPAG